MFSDHKILKLKISNNKISKSIPIFRNKAILLNAPGIKEDIIRGIRISKWSIMKIYPNLWHAAEVLRGKLEV